MQNQYDQVSEPVRKAALIIGGIAIIFLVGTYFGTTITKTPEKIVETVEVEKNGDTWRKLKTIDDQALELAVTNSELYSATLYAIVEGDAGTIEAITQQVKANNQEFEQLQKARANVVQELGY